MKALTLWQPWASLVALGVKTIETRSWSTSYRGPLAIHAGARQVHHGKFLLLARIARRAGLLDPSQEAEFRSLDVPFGSVVATCTLVDVLPIIDPEERTDEIAWIGSYAANEKLGIPAGLWVCDHSTLAPGRHVEDQRPYGDFAPGRFAWLLADIKPVDPPVPARGRQQLWEWAHG